LKASIGLKKMELECGAEFLLPYLSISKNSKARKSIDCGLFLGCKGIIKLQPLI